MRVSAPALRGPRCNPATPLPVRETRYADFSVFGDAGNASGHQAQCNQIDECQEWANKAEALASYARQAEDSTLHKLSDRIRARAVRSFPESEEEATKQVGVSRRWDTAVRVLQSMLRSTRGDREVPP